MTFLSRSAIVLLSLACTLALQANVAPPATDQVRSELWSYFKNIEKNSPTVLGGLAKSPESMAAIKQRIDSMTDAEAAEMRKMMAEAPDWKAAPEAISTAFPPQMLDHFRNMGSAYTKELPQAEKMRDEVRMLVGALRLAPDAKLLELGIDRAMLGSIEKTLDSMDALQLAALHRRVVDATDWRQQSAVAIETLPPAFRRGAMALAKHGPLSEQDIAELNEFRQDLIHVLIRLEMAPPEAKSKLAVGSLLPQIAQLHNAPPDVLFMIRHNVTPQTIEQLNQNVAYLYAMSSISDEKKAELEAFRGELTDAFRSMVGESEQWQQTEAMLSELDPLALQALQSRMQSFGDWQTAMPAVYQAILSPDLQARLQTVSGPSADPAAVAELETFRGQALAWIDAVAARGDIESSLVERARQVVASSPAEQLEVIRMSVEALPATATDRAKLSVAVMDHAGSLNCNVTLIPQFTLGQVCIPPGCADPCFGVFGGCEFCWGESCTPGATIGPVTANLDFFCNPMKAVIHTIGESVTSAANTVTSTMSTAINTLIEGMRTTVNGLVATVQNTIDTIVSGITSTINSVWTFLQNLPTTAWNAIKSAIEALLDFEIANGVTLRALLVPLINGGEDALEVALGKMHNLLGLAGNWWTAIGNFTLPLIPCPPANFHTPFGDVGTRAAADNYARYRLVIDGIVGMIPDTETSLFIKIPAKILFTAFHFFGMCLDQAANDADTAQLTERHGLVVTGFANVNLFVSSQIVGLTSSYDAQTTSILTRIGSQSTSMQGAMTNHSVTLQGVVNTEATEMSGLIETESQSIKDLIQSSSDQTQSDLDEFSKLNLKLTIERVLQAGANNEVALFQLQPPNGRLDLVAEIVRETLDALSAAGEGIGQARKAYDAAVALMSQGKDKDAFREFAKAYQQATK